MNDTLQKEEMRISVAKYHTKEELKK